MNCQLRLHISYHLKHFSPEPGSYFSCLCGSALATVSLQKYKDCFDPFWVTLVAVAAVRVHFCGVCASLHCNLIYMVSISSDDSNCISDNLEPKRGKIGTCYQPQIIISVNSLLQIVLTNIVPIASTMSQKCSFVATSLQVSLMVQALIAAYTFVCIPQFVGSLRERIKHACGFQDKDCLEI